MNRTPDLLITNPCSMMPVGCRNRKNHCKSTASVFISVDQNGSLLAVFGFYCDMGVTSCRPRDEKIRPNFTRIPLDMRSGSAKHWAWEFLRRNHEYRASYRLVATLGAEERAALSDYADQTFAIDEIPGALPYRVLESCIDIEDSVYANERSRFESLVELGTVADVKEMLVPEVHHQQLFWLQQRYSLQTYGLAQWIDPALTPAEVDDEIFQLRLSWTTGLIPIARPKNADEPVPVLQPGNVIFPFGTHKMVDPRRVPQGKASSRPKWTFYGYEGANGQYFDTQERVTFPLALSEIAFKVSLSRPLAPQIDAVHEAAASWLQQLQAAGVCEEMSASGGGILYTDYLELLDGIDEGLKGGALAERVGLAKLDKSTGQYKADGFDWAKAPRARDRLRQMTMRARALRDYEYLNLALG